jgi:predicted RNase H-like nuclease
MSALVAGVDGCRGGWVVVSRPVDDPGAAEVRLMKSFAEVLALRPAPEIIAVDIPIGLPERGRPGGRACDREARARLGGRQSSVFAVPARAAVMCEDYSKACNVAMDTSDPPKKVSKQTFHLFPKIREVDALMSPELQEHVLEVHPEVAFWALNGEAALTEPKKVKSRAYPPGLALRRGLLANAGYAPELLNSRAFRASEAGPDDLLDAAVNSWSASRIARGGGHRFPREPERDSKGLRMEIWG